MKRDQHMKMGKIAAALLGCLSVTGCAETTPTPETQVAAVIQGFQKSADGFTASRREIVKARQGILDDTEREAAEARLRADHLRSLWKIAGTNGKISLCDRVLAGTQAAADANDAMEKLGERHREALAAADTKVKLRQDKLTAMIKALTALGSPKDFIDQARFYFDYLQQTRSEIEKLQKDTTGKKDAIEKQRENPGAESTGRISRIDPPPGRRRQPSVPLKPLDDRRGHHA